MDTPDPGVSPAAPTVTQTTVHLFPQGSGSPWWAPDARIVIAAALFGLAWHLLDMIGANPNLAEVTLFVTIATGVFGGSGLFAVIGFYYMAAKKERDAAAQPPAGDAK